MNMEKFYSICLQGNILKAMEYLETVKDKNNDILALRKQYKQRFLSNNKIYEINSDDSWIKAVVGCYFDYFCAVLTNKPIQDAENNLIQGLSKLVNNDSYDFDEIESQLENIFKEKGYSFLGGITPPYRGPYIWKTTIKKKFNVSLIDNEQEVTVYFISDFLMLSWAHFATMGKRHTGGWANENGLYYVDNGSERVDVNSTKFKVWFLKHEAQHLSDYKRFPNLNARNLEYRAKLIELIFNPNSYDLIKKFLNQAKNDKFLPHPYAAYSIIKNMSCLLFEEEYVCNKHQWSNIGNGLISEVATKLFLNNNKSLSEAGKETEGII